MRREPRAPDPLHAVGLALLSAEETIAVVARATPTNARAELARLVEVGARRGRLRPAFVYAPPPTLTGIRRGLERVARESREHGSLGALHASRAEELELEARLVERIGAPGFAELAGKRFRAPRGELERRVAAFVEGALAEPGPAREPERERYASDDRTSPASLVQKLVRRAAELALPIRVEIRPGQLAIAATGHGVVAVRPGVSLSADVATRIALHELLAHALPRARSLHAPWPLLRAGTAGSVEAEEGRALIVEARAGHLDRTRRRELAFRHCAALGVRRGADFEETVRELTARGAAPAPAIEIAVRAQRGGGLAREIVYLPAYLEVGDAFGREPELERWFERGRVGLEAARELHELAAEHRAPIPVFSAQNPLCTV